MILDIVIEIHKTKTLAPNVDKQANKEKETKIKYR